MNWINTVSRTYMDMQEALRPKPKVLLIGKPSMINDVWGLESGDLAGLRKLAIVDVVTTNSMSEQGLAQRCEGYQYLMLNMDFLPFSDPNSMSKLTEKFYTHPGVRGLRGINVDMTDADFFSPELAKTHGILLQTTPNAVTRSVAESAVCEILMHAKGRAAKDTCTKGLNLYGKNAGIVGRGNIGKAVGGILSGMGMNVVYNDTDPRKGPSVPLKKMFSECQVISVHIPALQVHTNVSNEGFIGEELLNQCKGTIVVNLATDIIVDTDAMAGALRSGKVTGYSVEPGRKKTEKLHKLEGVRVSPCSFDSDESRRNVVRIWVENTITALHGNPQNVWN